MRTLNLIVFSASAVSILTLIPPQVHAETNQIGYDREAKLYAMPSGNTFTARFQHSSRGSGQFEIDLSTPQVLRGAYARVKTGDSRWGELFHSLGGSSNANISGLQRGTISAVGGGVSIRCEYVTTGTLQGGFGFCRDSTNATYRLLF